MDELLANYAVSSDTANVKRQRRNVKRNHFTFDLSRLTSKLKWIVGVEPVLFETPMLGVFHQHLQIEPD
jgi:hypothetical protein